jgi:hypothetical protein
VTYFEDLFVCKEVDIVRFYETVYEKGAAVLRQPFTNRGIQELDVLALLFGRWGREVKLNASDDRAVLAAKSILSILMEGQFVAAENKELFLPKDDDGIGIFVHEYASGVTNKPYIDSQDIATCVSVVSLSGRAQTKFKCRDGRFDDFIVEAGDLSAFASTWSGAKVPHQIGPMEGDRIALTFWPAVAEARYTSRPKLLPDNFFG